VRHRGLECFARPECGSGRVRANANLAKAGGYAVLLFAAVGVYLFFSFFSALSVATGGKPLPLGKPVLR
jgi:hypothetical protein